MTHTTLNLAEIGEGVYVGNITVDAVVGDLNMEAYLVVFSDDKLPAFQQVYKDVHGSQDGVSNAILLQKGDSSSRAIKDKEVVTFVAGVADFEEAFMVAVQKEHYWEVTMDCTDLAKVCGGNEIESVKNLVNEEGFTPTQRNTPTHTLN